ncbi:hypothetical protein NVV94_12405 [Pseudomonas sp. LS1212]|uniref:hypothetical protein n=1 Tax=Pseudomonas sp. LS1212 TaxID=2972478 RepID=UPI00215BE00B|nr:hypothetical protein [Pseudomonas sp. LS1212]UVJ46263.1 hypothetical protein NVV94_12405 [Pseudomonas sp. LS1212]
MDRARETFAEAADALGDNAVFDHADVILQRGTSADRQLRQEAAQARAGIPLALSLERIVDQLLIETATV